MQMGNTVPRAGLKLTSLAFRAGVLPLDHIGSLMSPLFPCPPARSGSKHMRFEFPDFPEQEADAILIRPP